MRLTGDWFNVFNSQRAVTLDQTFSINSGVTGVPRSAESVLWIGVAGPGSFGVQVWRQVHLLNTNFRHLAKAIAGYGERRRTALSPFVLEGSIL